jgi:integrase
MAGSVTTLAFLGFLRHFRWQLEAGTLTGKQRPASRLLPETGPLSMKIDDSKTVARLALPDGKADAIFFDDDLAGFGLRLRKSGDRVRRTWVAQYRIRGRTRRMKIGAFEKLTPTEARKAARKVLAKVEVGDDPQAERAEERLKASHSLISVIRDYLSDAKPRLRPNSYRSIRLYLEDRAYFGPLHSTTITEVTLADVAARLGAIKRASGGTTAARARGALAAVYAWAAGEGLLGAHPVNIVAWTNKPAAGGPRDRVLSDSELAAVWRACGDDEGGKITKLLILTGQRRAEVGGMRWPELVDLPTWTLPKERTKNQRPHTVPLAPLAVEIIEGVPQRVGRDCLFGERAKVGFTRWAQAKAEIDDRLGGAVQLWHVHDLRRTFATRAGDLGVQPHIVETILNHVSGHKRGIAGVYNKSVYLNEVRAALVLWSDHIRAITEGGERKVVPMLRQVPG